MTIPPSLPEEPKNDQQNRHDEADNLLNYFKTHTRETVAYILLILGIIWMFFDPIFGGILVGIITGIYFGDEIIAYIIHWKENIHGESAAHHLIKAGIAIAFFISAPAIFLGAAISIAIKHLFIGPTLGK